MFEFNNRLYNDQISINYAIETRSGRGYNIAVRESAKNASWDSEGTLDDAKALRGVTGPLVVDGVYICDCTITTVEATFDPLIRGYKLAISATETLPEKGKDKKRIVDINI